MWPEVPTCHVQANEPHLVGSEACWNAPRFGQFFRTCYYCNSIHPEDLFAAIDAGARLGGSDWKYGWPHKFYVHGIPDTRQGSLVCKGSKPIADGELRRWLQSIPLDTQRLILRSISLQIPLDQDLFDGESMQLVAALRDGIVLLPGGVIERAVIRARAVAAIPEADRIFGIGLGSDPLMAPATTAHAKWYNAHLLDEGYGDEARAKLIAALAAGAGILFHIGPDGRLGYRAPSVGYQR